ncbi:hypothetical protein [Labilibaculum euxinus]|uniref:hypothetical protein n=1 Tax=Labilibaculum euxinus TaxID=2686357 RepID=UPI000F616484|nr:hypothetical protein [Labilibaculum euxinus]MDQ1770766.1 hypothetical protein [Labilibaculum euxinus]
MKNLKNELKSIKMMKNSNGVDFAETTVFCKCQACNNISIKHQPLKKEEVEKMFETVKAEI